MERRRTGLVVALLTANLVGIVLLAGWATWAVSAPEYWFPDAFAEKGARGEQGPQGERGPIGPSGPEGPAGPGVDDVMAGVEDLEARVDNLEGVDIYDVEQRLSDAETRVDEACSTLSLDLDTYGC
jgi:hypothetical protein